VLAIQAEVKNRIRIRKTGECKLLTSFVYILVETLSFPFERNSLEKLTRGEITKPASGEFDFRDSHLRNLV
jgi:hypothetical protein